MNAEERAVAKQMHASIVSDAAAHPEDQCAHQLAVGSMHMQKGNLHKAEKAFRRAISAYPTAPVGYHNLAVVLSR